MKQNQLKLSSRLLLMKENQETIFSEMSPFEIFKSKCFEFGFESKQHFKTVLKVNQNVF